ncbi:MAG: VCBS repeat-containing protein [Opitutaceae bacterium]
MLSARRSPLVVSIALLAGWSGGFAYETRPLRTSTPAAPGARPFSLLSEEQTHVNVPNVFDDPSMWGARFRELTLGSVETGIAIADFDQDGQPDIFAISKNGPCALYRQVAPFIFVDVAAVAGVTCPGPANNTGATAVDINQDGAMDLYVCRNDAPNLLFINNGDGTFEERAAEYGLAVRDSSVHALFADYDRDGDLDAYLVTNILDFDRNPKGRPDYLFRNNGDGTFVDVAESAGIWGATQGHTAIWFDPNGDGWPDLYVANDFETPDRFYLNKGDGTFADVVDQRLPHVTYFSMGADSGDLNNDGLVDFMVADMRDRTHAEYLTGIEEMGRGLWEMERVSELVPQYMWNAVYLNSGTERFLEVAHLLGMYATGWTFGARFADLDTDGRLDAFFTTGMIRNFLDADLVDRQNRAPSLAARAAMWKTTGPRTETTLAYRNLGDLAFADVSEEWGLNQAGVAFGCALADLDGDGDLDLVYSNYGAPPTIIRNDHSGGHRILVRLEGRAPNRDGIGSELILESASGRQVRQLFTERGIVASEPPLVHFGLGDDAVVSKLTIRWPLGQVQELEDLPVDRLIVVKEPPRDEERVSPAVAMARGHPKADFQENAADRGIRHISRIRPFDEFTRQRLLPRRMNGQGPALATGDVNSDGRVDVFITGLGGQSGVLYLGKDDGGFSVADSQPWAAAAEAEDLGAVFADVDGDGHPDLVVAAGGVAVERGDPLLNDRIYLNDGRGHFLPVAMGALPPDGESGGAVAADDFDGDGRVDLFVGGRLVPGHYPETPRSFLYRNNGDGTFVDVTDSLAPDLRSIGMVTAAEWADLDGDGKVDLVLALEWGPITCLRNTGTGLVPLDDQSGLSERTGWWSALAVADVNGDGRLDLVAGNVGLNTKYRASVDKPAVLFAGVFDRSGSEQLVEARFSEGRLMPERGRSKLSYVFPWITRKFPTFLAFSKASVEDIFGVERLSGVRRLTATELASGVYLNLSGPGKMRFEFHRLPREAQIAPINAVVARDLDGDGTIDLACVGNQFGPEPSTGRFDGGLGVILKGDGRGGFQAESPARSGFVVPGEARSVAALESEADAGPSLLVGRSGGPVLLFTPD